MAGKLYIVGTPIGNLGDISPRALKTLAEADFIAAEDTRVSLGLLSHFGIKKPLVSYHEHNRHESGQKIIRRLLDGESCALVTDAGMPCISDPGEELVRSCAGAGIETVVIPGPTAAMSALALSGLPSGRFTFEGFLSVKKGSRRAHLEELHGERRTMLFYEAPHKLPATLRDLYDSLGERRVALCRELTKLYEEVWRTTLSEAAAHYAENTPRGEFVLVVEGASESDTPETSFEQAVEMTLQLQRGGAAISQAAKEVAHQTGYKKGELYKAALDRL